MAGRARGWADPGLSGPVAEAGFRAGDVLGPARASAGTVVTGIAPSHVRVRRPWGTVDPDSRFRWDGDHALCRPRDHDEWDKEVFRASPGPSGSAAGDPCRVGIPPTTVHVVEAHRFDPPRDVGSLPRPAHLLWVPREGTSLDPDLDDQGCRVHPDGPEPIERALLFLPYVFLEPGDEVADAQGTAWTFAHPWAWPSPGGRTGTPVWPLTLLARDGRPAADGAAREVATATVTSSHQDEEERWRGFTGAEPSLP